MRTTFKLVLIFLLSFTSVGCVKRHKFHPAPVLNGWKLPAASKNAYVVQKNDTLYSIAWAFGMDYRDLADVNHINRPYNLYAGQKIFILHSKHTHFAKSNGKKILANSHVSNVFSWLWPASGRVVASFNNTFGGNKGIDIGGKYAEPVIASAAGKVVYCGSGIPTYGNLIIIKHNDDFLSAYAYNSKTLVYQGQIVSQGQKIATMGKNNAGLTRLHFEIRQVGKPVNPIFYLPKKHV